MTTLFVILPLIANTAFVSLGGEWEELCVVTSGDSPTELYQGDCRDAVKQVVEEMRDKNKNAIINIIINNENLNRI